MEALVYAFCFFLPAGIANMTPIFASRLPVLKRWNTPVDLGHSFRGKRIFGDHKTWRGIIIGTIAGTVFGVIGYSIARQLFDDTFFDAAPILVFSAMSFGALFGDAIKSFWKRQLGIASGRSWFPFDQTDYIIGGLAFVAPLGVLTLRLACGVAVLYFGLHLLSAYIGYLLGLKDAPV